MAMRCRTVDPLFLAAMTFVIIISFIILGVFVLWPITASADAPCPDGRSCPDTWRCCEHGCCAPSTTLAPSSTTQFDLHMLPYPVWYHAIPILLVMVMAFACTLLLYITCFRRTRPCCVPRAASEHDSAGSCYPPPHYSRCGSFLQAPPHYSEVTSKPDLYPLVITCGEGDNKQGGGDYLMVHYFRAPAPRAPGSMSATSTAESLNSSFICNAANEANSIIPPPYSCASNYEEWRDGTLLRSLSSSLTEPRSPRAPPRSRTAPPAPPAPPFRPAVMTPDEVFMETIINPPARPLLDSTYDLELELLDYDPYCDTGNRPRLGPSPPVPCSPSDTVFENDFERLRHLYSYQCPSLLDRTACESPPQPTSPTQTSRESTLRRPSDERRQRRPETAKKYPKARKTSLYMPLSTAYPVRTSARVSPGARVSSRSAPVTPCGSLVPNLLALTQRVSSSRYGSRSSKLEEENDPLLSDENGTRTDHKF